MTALRRLSPHPLLAAGALFAFLLVVARAYVQSITIDEADSFLIWAARSDASHWVPAANNHVLNSLLMRLFTTILGPSHLAVRAPALLGAFLYIAAAYWLCSRLLTGRVLPCAMLVCLVYNPFVLDYLVAARGYSLAVGLLLCALAAAAHPPLRITATCALCSASLALSLAANFSFAFVDAAALLVIFLAACRTRRDCGRLLAACVVPGLAVTLLVSGYPVLYRPRGQLWYGAASLRETFGSVAEASLYEINPHLANPLLLPVFRGLAPFLFPLVGVFAAGRLVAMFRAPGTWVDRWLAMLGGAAAAILTLALLAHWLSFRFFHLLLPKDRTALYIAPLATLAVASVAAIPPHSRIAWFFGRGLTVLLFITGLYFVFCLRLTYFQEWKWDADVRAAYEVLARYNRTHGVRDIATSWQYVAPLNFYRRVFGGESMGEITSVTPYPLDRQVYVLHGGFDQPFIAEQRLQIVYRGENSEVLIAIRP
jgi:hypothetical protein